MSSITLLIHIGGAALQGLGFIFWFITLPFGRFREQCVQELLHGVVRGRDQNNARGRRQIMPE